MSLEIPTHHGNSELESIPSNNPIDDTVLAAVIPRKGRLIPLRTKAEVEHSSPQIIQAYTAEIPQKSANEVLRAIDALIHAHNTLPPNLQHLRRIIKPSALPAHLRPTVLPELPQPTLYLLAYPTASLPLSTLQTLLAAQIPSFPPNIFTCDIPLYPPTSEDQARAWSERYWPSVWRKFNPWGPQPSEVEKAEAELRGDVGRIMGLALEIGKEAEEGGMGVGVGVVIADDKGRVIVAAGDGRWADGNFCPKDREREEGRGNGNPMAHAVMRAIGMVARKRRDLASQYQAPPSPNPQDVPENSSSRQQKSATAQGKERNHFFDHPLTPLENQIYVQSPLAPGGYLCLDLTIYITHEPCVMCSMAILHSRFSKIIYGQPMPKTGGMSAEVKHDTITSTTPSNGEGKVEGEAGGLGYGLFWRPELNWRLLGWRWEDDDPQSYGNLDGDMHV
ncbi:MAG: hypothetical protein Q9209_004291 [Squamulea sp. 1 TL-2023]